MTDREYMDVRQLAEFLSVSRATIYRYTEGRGVKEPLPVIRLARNKLIFEVARVRDWLDRIGGYPTLAEIEAEEDPSKS